MDIREIARRARVSTATVFRTPNRVHTVDLRAERMWKVVNELGSYPNARAYALAIERSTYLWPERL